MFKNYKATFKGLAFSGEIVVVARSIKTAHKLIKEELSKPEYHEEAVDSYKIVETTEIKNIEKGFITHADNGDY